MTDGGTKRHTCCENVIPTEEWHSHPCGKTAKFERDGKWYCSRHDPVAITEKRAARYTKWDAEWTIRQNRSAFVISCEKAIRDIARVLMILSN